MRFLLLALGTWGTAPFFFASCSTVACTTLTDRGTQEQLKEVRQSAQKAHEGMLEKLLKSADEAELQENLADSITLGLGVGVADAFIVSDSEREKLPYQMCIAFLGVLATTMTLKRLKQGKSGKVPAAIFLCAACLPVMMKQPVHLIFLIAAVVAFFAKEDVFAREEFAARAETDLNQESAQRAEACSSCGQLWEFGDECPICKVPLV